MYLNRFGELAGGCSGGGQGEVSALLNTGEHILIAAEKRDASGAVIEAGGVGGWLDDDHVCYGINNENGTGKVFIYAYNVRTKKRVLLIERGFNRLKAGGGKWAGWGSNFGVFGDFRSEIGWVATAGRDGTFAIVGDYQADSDCKLYALDGRVTALPDNENAFDIHVTGPTSAIWIAINDNQQFRTLNMRVPLQAGPAFAPKIARVGEEDWVVYWTDKFGLITHPVDSLKGYVVRDAATASGQDAAYWHDAIELNDKIRVAYSRRQGETRGDFVSRDIDLTAERVNFADLRDGGVPPKLPPFSQFTGFSTGGSSTANGSSLVQPQLGLLEDDIVYRLALLAVNVIQPLKDRYENIVIKSGFRQVNSGISQHEMGEAVDIQIVNQTPELLYEVANWMQNNLAFDQLVLNFSNIGDGEPWIHVSFSPNSLRHQVLTKDFADTFHEGLFFVEPYSGEEAAEAERERTALDTLIFDEMTKISKRNAKMLPISAVMDEVQSVLTGSAARESSGVPGGGGGPGSGNTDKRVALVACVQRALGLRGTPEDSQENADIAFETAKRVAWLLRDEGCGLLIGPQGGENIVQWNGYFFRAGRVAFADGQVYKILTAVENGPQQGGQSPIWSDEGATEASLYIPAMDPGTDFNLNWMQCELPPIPPPGGPEEPVPPTEPPTEPGPSA